MELNKALGIRFTEKDESELRKRAEDKGIKLSSYVRVVVKEHLKKQ
tara:strand:+ start:667 stop:804 length:138 start_codon:yes stop_codon:yes gene_type:complete